jgi:hypothetical protein
MQVFPCEIGSHKSLVWQAKMGLALAARLTIIPAAAYV